MRSTTASPDAEEQPNDRLRRSVVTERYIETAIVADRTMLEKHGRRNLESYLYSLMNVVRSSPIYNASVDWLPNF